MEIFNIGFGELFFIILIALVILGPNEMTKAARTVGKTVRQLLRSPMWSEIVTTSQQIRDLPNKIIREANLEETIDEVKKTAGELQSEMKEIDRETQTLTTDISGSIITEEHKAELEKQKRNAAETLSPQEAELQSGETAHPSTIPANPEEEPSEIPPEE